MEQRVPFDPYAYDFHEDPYPTYARLRAEAPVYYNAAQDFWALAKHEDVRNGFRNNVQLSNAWGVSMDPGAYSPDASKSMSFLAMDDPKHMRIRKLVSKGFTPRRVNELADNIRKLTKEHWDKCLEMGEFDYVTDFAGKLPMDVVSELLDVPVADRAYLREQSDLLIHREEGVLDIPEAAVHAFLGLHGYYTNLLAERRKNPGEDLVSALLDAEIVDEESGENVKLSDEDIVGFMFLMVVAGNETTTKLLANAVYWAHENRPQLDRVLADPDIVPLWTEETLRFDNSTQMVLRRVIEDVEFGGIVIPAQQRVLLLVGSANRDTEVFGDDADQYILGRDVGQTLMSFGVGTHFCLGAHLARLESNIGLDEVIRSVKDYQLDLDKAVRVHSVNVRGFANLPMKVQAR
ncbi:cytochrome P450 [Gordonia sp. (in: high G+C Gram-positive bacteria)]|uniref:cytochrome P450 n=1 Tax=Gordonia sp. (in: high G+C Gram-positive bacteria) TaxID=84139 RepID=UPI0039E4C524